MSGIVVSGVGVWSGAGTSAHDLARQVTHGPDPDAIRRFGPLLLPTVPAPEPPPFPRFPQARRMDRSVRLALAAAAQAFAAARLDSLDPARIAILVGNSRGPAGTWCEPLPRRLRPTQAAHSAIASLSGALSLAFQVRGPCLTVSATCASAAHAIALGASLLRAGEVDAVLAGGAEAPLVGPLLDQFHAAGILGTHPDPARACRPFDRTRNGILPGEAAAFLVLEIAGHAHARHLEPIALLAGWAMGSEAHNRVATRADGAGLAAVLRQALDRASVSPEQIGYLNAHGTGTLVNDAAEAAAIRSVFGTAEQQPLVSSTKPVTGHAFGAAAALEAVIVLEALKTQLAPPTPTCTEPDLTLGLNLVLDQPRRIEKPYGISTSLGFWGNTAALVFRNPQTRLDKFTPHTQSRAHV